jgi:hypothetical protein
VLVAALIITASRKFWTKKFLPCDGFRPDCSPKYDARIRRFSKRASECAATGAIRPESRASKFFGYIAPAVYT